MNITGSLKMLISMPTRFDAATIAIVNTINQSNPAHKIGEIYGSVPDILWGTGRDGDTLPKMTIEQVCSHIKAARKIGLHFNYIMNAPCYKNDEYDRGMISQLFHTFDQLVDCGLDVITLANPYLISLFKKTYPTIQINASAVLHIIDFKTASFYASMGAQRITLHSDINRDLKRIKDIQSNLDCDIEIMANPRCLLNCPIEKYHYNVLGHKETGRALGNWFNFCTMHCAVERLKKPEEVFMSGWFRPKDTYKYEELGIDYLKIVGREFALSTIYKITKHYACEESVPNMGDILGGYAAYRLPSGKIVSSLMYIDTSRDDLYEKRFHCANACLSDCGSCTICRQMADSCLVLYERENNIELIDSIIEENVSKVAAYAKSKSDR
ncbi:MAG: hypothetical protein HFE77_01385 [Clostridiales bacterium]|nr:hypothetical protein [Clostridiales bacterium]